LLRNPIREGQGPNWAVEVYDDDDDDDDEVMQGQKSEVLTLQNWDYSAKGDNPDRKHRPSRIAGDWAWG
jgi:hypothetical protein